MSVAHEPQTHDYRNPTRSYGHDLGYVLASDGRLEAYGWGRGIHRGDFLLLSYPGGGETRYRVESIHYADDPRDQWFATLVFAPRSREEMGDDPC